MNKKIFLLLFIIILKSLNLSASETQNTSSKSSSSSSTSSSTINFKGLTKFQNFVLSKVIELDELKKLPIELLQLIISLTPEYNEQATSELFWALNPRVFMCEEDKEKKIKDAINNFADVSCADRYGCPFIEYPIKNREFKCLKILIESDENIKGKNMALGLAVANCSQYNDIYFDMIELLLQHGADANSIIEDELDLDQKIPLLNLAASRNIFKLIDLLLKYKANPNIQTLVRRYVRIGDKSKKTWVPIPSSSFAEQAQTNPKFQEILNKYTK